MRSAIVAGWFIFAIVLYGLVVVNAKPIARAPLTFAAASQTVTVTLKSVDGSTLTCPAQSAQLDGWNLTVFGLACPADRVFRNGFEP